MSEETRGPVVLVVDDEPALRRVVRTALVRRGVSVLEAGGGDEALALLKGTRVAVVLTDVRMPDGDGMHLLERIMADIPAPPRVILATGYADLTEEDARRLGAAALVEKPFDFRTLVKMVLEAAQPEGTGIAPPAVSNGL